MAVPVRPAGWPLWSYLVALVLLIALGFGLIMLGRSWDPVHGVLSWLGRPRRVHQPEPVTPASFTTDGNHTRKVWLPTLDDELLKEQKRLAKALQQQAEINAQILKDLEALRKRQRDPGHEAGDKKAEPKPKAVKRPDLMFANYEGKHRDLPQPNDGQLIPGTWVHATLQSAINSEIPGQFSMTLRRPVVDSLTGKPLIPSGRPVVGTADTGSLLFGNERVPTFALRTSHPDGAPLELGRAQIMDPSGENGLTAEVDNHIWRLIWTSVFIGGLRGGQQVLTREFLQDGTGAVGSSILREGSSVAQQRLGRMQDTRPTLRVAGGQPVVILLGDGLRVPMTQEVSK